MKWLIVAILLIAGSAQAEPTVQVWAERGDYVVSMVEVDAYSHTFDMVITVATGEHDMAGLDFSIAGMPPGVLMVGEEYPEPTTVNLEPEGTGRYRLRFDACASSCELREVLRVTWGAYQGVPAPDTIVSVVGLDGPDPVLIDCEGGEQPAPMGGHAGGASGMLVELPEGGLMINPSPPCVLVRRYCGFDWAARVPCGFVIEAEPRSLTTLKSRFGN